MSSVCIKIFYAFYQQKRNSWLAFFLAIGQRIMQYCPGRFVSFFQLSVEKQTFRRLLGLA